MSGSVLWSVTKTHTIDRALPCLAYCPLENSRSNRANTLRSVKNEDEMYTVFGKQRKNPSGLWTEEAGQGSEAC
jgi:hypothetical protein